MIIVFRAIFGGIVSGNEGTEITIVFGQIRNVFLDFTLTEELARKVMVQLGVATSLGNSDNSRFQLTNTTCSRRMY